MRIVYVSTYTIYLSIYIYICVCVVCTHVHDKLENWLRTLGLLGFSLGKVKPLPRRTPARLSDASSGQAHHTGRISRTSSSGRVYHTGREITFWHGEEHSHFQPEVVWKIYETSIFKTKHNSRFRVYPVGNPNGGIWGSVPSGESLRTGMSALEMPVGRRRSGLSHQTAEEAEAKSIPKDTFLPVLMISLCCFNNTAFWLSSLVSFPHTLRLYS